jgi:hypothetical protein
MLSFIITLRAAIIIGILNVNMLNVIFENFVSLVKKDLAEL